MKSIFILGSLFFSSAFAVEPMGCAGRTNDFVTEQPAQSLTWEAPVGTTKQKGSTGGMGNTNERLDPGSHRKDRQDQGIITIADA